MKRYTFRNRSNGVEISLLASDALSAWERFERELIDALYTHHWYLKAVK